MEKRKNNLKNVYLLAYGAAIAAIYVTLTMVFAPISFGPIQFRISEILCVLPFFTRGRARAVFRLLFSQPLLRGGGAGCGVRQPGHTDRGGGLLVSGKEEPVAGLPAPILANTVIIPWVLRYAYGSTDLIPFAMVTVGVGEILAIGVLGNMLLFTLDRYKGLLFKKSLA